MHQSGLSRRNLLLGATAVAGLPLLRATRALAAPDFKGKTVVFASWGGAYQNAEQTCYCDPFAAATGAKVLQDGPMNDAKFRAMIQSGAPDWDVADITIDFLYAGIKDNLFEKIDTKLVDTSRISPQFVNDYGIGCIVWSYNSASDRRLCRRKGAADLGRSVRSEAFPGKRTLADNPSRPWRSLCSPMASRPTSSIRSTSTAL